MKSVQAVRQDLLAVLAQLSEFRPEWRLGQTMANLATTAGRMDSGGVWELEDEEALAAARTLIEQYSQSETVVPKVAAPASQVDAPSPTDGVAARPGEHL